MIALKIREVKNFMSCLFQKSVFDQFLVREVEVQTACSYKVGGHRNVGFYSQEELEGLPDREYLRWEELKPQVFQMIRGSRTPLLLSAVLSAGNQELDKVLAMSGSGMRREDISGAYINLKYQSGELVVISGTSLNTFVPDKSFGQAWDQYVRGFLKEKEILFDEL